MSSTACPPGGDTQPRDQHPARHGDGALTTSRLLPAREECPHRIEGRSSVPAAAAPQLLWSAAMHLTLSLLADLAAPVPGPKSLPQVISGITTWVMGILAL